MHIPPMERGRTLIQRTNKLMHAPQETPDCNRDAIGALHAAQGSGVAPVTLAQRVAIARDMVHLTLNEAAQRIGVSASLVSLWENGQRTISQPQLFKICRAYGVSLDWLCNAQTIPRFRMPETKRRRTMPKAKVTRMKIELSAKPDGFKVEWNDPVEKARETFAHFHECLTAMLKAHGLMKEDGK